MQWKEKKISILLFGMFFLFFSLISPIFAQETEEQTQESLRKDQILFKEPTEEELKASKPDTTTEVMDARILSQRGNVFDIEFSLTNGLGIQPDVRYSIRLVDGTTNDFYFATLDEKIYPEIISLGENASLKKQITYTAPEYLSGEYTLSLFASNSSGRLLSLNTVGEGKITLTSSKPFVFIERKSCKLSVKGEAGKEYTLEQGLDVKKEETMLLTCGVKNNTKEKLTLIPTFKTFERNSFGKPIEDIPASQEQFILNAGETKTLTLEVPLANIPQAYDTKLSFTNTENIPSNEIISHYVIQGKSATIGNLLLDKKSYTKGETANVELFWSGSADTFFGSRAGLQEKEDIIASILLLDEKNTPCTQESKTVLNNLNRNKAFIQIPIIAECPSYQAQVDMRDANGNVLAQKTYSFLKVQEKGINDLREKALINEEERNPVFLFLSLSVFLLLVMLILFVVKKRGGRKSVQKIVSFLFFLGFFSVGLMTNVHEADAASQTADYGACVTYYSAKDWKIEDCTQNHKTAFFSKPDGIVWSGAPGTYPAFTFIDYGYTLTISTEKSVYQDNEGIKYNFSLSNVAHGGSLILGQRDLSCPDMAFGCGDIIRYTQNIHWSNASSVISEPALLLGYTHVHYMCYSTNGKPNEFDIPVGMWEQETYGKYGPKFVGKTGINFYVKIKGIYDSQWDSWDGSCGLADRGKYQDKSEIKGSDLCNTYPLPRNGLPTSPLPISSPTTELITLKGNKFTWSCPGNCYGEADQCSADYVVGVCGSANGTHPYYETIFAPGRDQFCSSGTASPVKPIFPNVQGGSVSWTCDKTFCTAYRGLQGVCGSASGNSFETLTPTSPNMCSRGSVTGFKLVGSTFSWVCAGSNGGPNSLPPCSANKSISPPEAINGKCGTNSDNYSCSTNTYPGGGTFCALGTLSPPSPLPDFPVQGGVETWDCLGENDGTKAPGGCIAKRDDVSQVSCKADISCLKGNVSEYDAGQLCGTGNTFAIGGKPKYASGEWTWTCQGNSCTSPPNQTKECKAPQCAKYEEVAP
ncbi:MAG: hypothetical protein IPN70_05400 [Candidatus Moraniibacteriota bacterium]|nr:MAG: hypothetical protein IPN70_05400 [Candidatus Moranbacteria bacterium]